MRRKERRIRRNGTQGYIQVGMAVLRTKPGWDWICRRVSGGQSGEGGRQGAVGQLHRGKTVG